MLFLKHHHGAGIRNRLIFSGAGNNVTTKAMQENHETTKQQGKRKLCERCR